MLARLPLLCGVMQVPVAVREILPCENYLLRLGDCKDCVSDETVVFKTF
jgi:hypothetical protein